MLVVAAAEEEESLLPEKEPTSCVVGKKGRRKGEREIKKKGAKEDKK